MKAQGLAVRPRGVALGTALVLAVGATAAVFLYVKNVREEARSTPSSNMTTVIVSKQDIPAGTNLDTLISQGALTTVQIPQAALVQGVVTDLSQIKGRSTSATILEGEQITTGRLQGSTERTGGVLGIRDGYEAITLWLEPPQGGGGFIRAGDHVTVWATVQGKEKEDVSVTVVPDVRVLRTIGGSVEDVRKSNTQVQLSLELTPPDAQRVLLAQQSGSIWLGLLPPGQTGAFSRPMRVAQLLAPRKV